MIHKIILGTVQFGLNYGINNLAGIPSGTEVINILDTAFNSGIRSLDTAGAYGDSISIIGNYHKKSNSKFKVLSKFKNVSQGEMNRIVQDSLDLLNIEQFEVYSYHSFSDYLNNHFLINDLIELKSKGFINKIGISVYSNLEFEKVVEDKNIDVIQLPYNVLDNYNLRGSIIERAKLNRKEIHVRSVFMQGLFFMDFDKFPVKLRPLKSYIQIIKDLCNSKSISIQSLALSYALFNKNIDNVIIGVDTSSQLIKNIESIVNVPEIFNTLNNSIFVKEIDLLNPSNWK